LKAPGFSPCTDTVKTRVSKFDFTFNSYRYNEVPNLKNISFIQLVKRLKGNGNKQSAAARKKRKLEEVGDGDGDGGGQLGSGGGSGDEDQSDATACDDEELDTVDDGAEDVMPDAPDVDGSPLAAAPSSSDECYRCNIPFDASAIETERHYFSCGHAIWCGECALVMLCTHSIQPTPSLKAPGFIAFDPCAHNKVKSWFPKYSFKWVNFVCTATPRRYGTTRR
jgi:hypothetical protein